MSWRIAEACRAWAFWWGESRARSSEFTLSWCAHPLTRTTPCCSALAPLPLPPCPRSHPPHTSKQALLAHLCPYGITDAGNRLSSGRPDQPLAGHVHAQALYRIGHIHSGHCFWLRGTFPGTLPGLVPDQCSADLACAASKNWDRSAGMHGQAGIALACDTGAARCVAAGVGCGCGGRAVRGWTGSAPPRTASLHRTVPIVQCSAASTPTRAVTYWQQAAPMSEKVGVSGGRDGAAGAYAGCGCGGGGRAGVGDHSWALAPPLGQSRDAAIPHGRSGSGPPAPRTASWT